MVSYGQLKIAWDVYRLARQYISQGEILDRAAANKKMTCPRCKSHLEWVEARMFFRCMNSKCSHKEGVSRDVDNRLFFLPPNGSDYWVVTVGPPRWFLYEVYG